KVKFLCNLVNTTFNKSKEDNMEIVECDTVPLTFKDAMNNSNSNEWKIAMQNEFNSLTENNTWNLVDRPLNRNIIGCRWVYVLKEVPGQAKRFKARLVAKGYSQIPGL